MTCFIDELKEEYKISILRGRLYNRMLLSKTAIVKWNSRIQNHYINLGYIYTRMNDEFKVKIEDLTCGSHALVEVKCDCCDKTLFVPWKNYSKYSNNNNGKYYCQICATKTFVKDRTAQTRLNNGISFEQWCIDNNRQDVLNRWDYELNDCIPKDILFSAHKKIWFTCDNKKHKSEVKVINAFTGGQDGSITCNQCNSIAQWGIDNIGEDFLEKYWDYEKNKVSPWELTNNTKMEIYIKCIDKIYHGSYLVSCNAFVGCNSRCPYCSTRHGKVHPLDSLGELYPKSLTTWSNKNKKTPYNYTPMSHQLVWWVCESNIHNDYRRMIKTSNKCDFRCPECQYSKGENIISNYLVFNKISYFSQKTFANLFGSGGGLLSYDFYLPEPYNLLIEYQGEQHEKPINFNGNGVEFSIRQFKKQQEHDRRKREYSITNNMDLLEIWYYDFDRIKDILDEKLGMIKENKNGKNI